MKEIKIQLHPDDEQIVVKLYPKFKGKPKTKAERYRRSIDILRLELKSMEGQNKTVDMTPNEALDLANILISSVNVYLMEGNKEYQETIVKKLDWFNSRELTKQEGK